MGGRPKTSAGITKIRLHCPTCDWRAYRSPELGYGTCRHCQTPMKRMPTRLLGQSKAAQGVLK